MPLQDRHLRDLADDVGAITLGVRELGTRFTQAQMVWRPGPGKWCMLECVDHLIRTGEQYHPRIAEAVETARSAGRVSEEPYRASRFARWFIKKMSPGTAALPTFASFRPAEPSSLAREVLERFTEQQNELLRLFELADGYDLNGKRFASPASWLVRFSIGEALTLLVVHQQRHLLQARNVAAQPGFPES